MINKKIVRHWIFASLLLIFSKGVGYAQALPSESYDLAISKGIHSLNQERYEEALAAFQEALKAKPDDLQATYNLGVAQRLLRRYEQAEKTFKAVTAQDPSFQPVHFDLGVVAYNLEQYDEALKELLLADSAESPSGSRQAMTQYYLGMIFQKQDRFKDSTPRFLRAAAMAPELEANARYFAGVAFYRDDRFVEARDELERVVKIAQDEKLLSSSRDLLRTIDVERLSKKRLSATVSVGGQYDTNVILLPVGSTLPSGISNQSDISMVATLQAAYRLLQTPRWDGSVHYDFYQSVHQDLHDFDVQRNDLGLTFIRFPSKRPYQLDFTYLFSDARVGGDDYFRMNAASLGLEFSRTADYLTRIAYQYQYRNFFQTDIYPSNRDRTGINHSFGVTQYWFFSGKDGNLHGGYTYDKDITSGDDWDSRGHRLNFGITFPPVWVQPVLEAELTLRYYENPNSLSPDVPQEKRKDTIQVYTLTLSRVFTPWLSGSIQYLYTSYASNIEAYEYDRQITSVWVTATY